MTRNPLRALAAIACARLAYRYFREWTAGARWQALRARCTRGARAQRLLRASTSTNDPACDDLQYVEALVALDTVNTLPLPTLTAYRGHRRPAVRSEEGLDTARGLAAALRSAGIDLAKVAGQLEREGVRKFI